MRSKMGCSGVAAVALIVGAVARGAAQQPRGLEFGMDAGLFHYSYNIGSGSISSSSSSTVLSFPVSAVRLAFPMSGPFELEPAASFAYSSSNGHTALNFGGEVGLLMEISGGPKESQWFFRPSVGLQHASSSSFSTSDRATLGAGLGVRMPLTDRISARYEARYQDLTRANNFSGNVFGLLAGISVFTR